MMFRLLGFFIVGQVVVQELRNSLKGPIGFGRMQQPRSSALLLLRAYSMYFHSKRMIGLLEK